MQVCISIQYNYVLGNYTDTYLVSIMVRSLIKISHSNSNFKGITGLSVSLILSFNRPEIQGKEPILNIKQSDRCLHLCKSKCRLSTFIKDSIYNSKSYLIKRLLSELCSPKRTFSNFSCRYLNPNIFFQGTS